MKKLIFGMILGAALVGLSTVALAAYKVVCADGSSYEGGDAHSCDGGGGAVAVVVSGSGMGGGGGGSGSGSITMLGGGLGGLPVYDDMGNQIGKVCDWGTLGCTPGADQAASPWDDPNCTCKGCNKSCQPVCYTGPPEGCENAKNNCEVCGVRPK